MKGSALERLRPNQLALAIRHWLSALWREHGGATDRA
jgi:hypothetical protein